jgi:adenylate kinase family enzyme
MKKLFLIRGLPGSGKSTFAKLIGGIVLEAD